MKGSQQTLDRDDLKLNTAKKEIAETNTMIPNIFRGGEIIMDMIGISTRIDVRTNNRNKVYRYQYGATG